MNGGLAALILRALSKVGLAHLAKRTAAWIVRLFTHEEPPDDHRPPRSPY